MYQTDVKIISNKKISKDFFLLTFVDKKIARYSKPGQFIMINPVRNPALQGAISNRVNEFFFRRPFSICGINNDRFDVLFKVVGKGTEILSGAKCGDTFNIIGPLGNGYPYLPTRLLAYSPILVAGGTGIASLLFLAQSLNPRLKSGATTVQPLVFIGVKTKKEIMFEKELKKCKCKVIVSTEDGSYGTKGLVTDAFSRYLSTYQLISLSTVTYACGPRPMLGKISKTCGRYNLKCFVSLEEKMACGLGACMGCVVKTRINADDMKCHCESRSVGTKQSQTQINADKFEYKRICKDGPVFDAREIVW